MANILAVAGPGSKYRLPGAGAAGFWAGLWHGLICPITFIVSLFNSNVRIYEVNNRGRWYDFGFILGASCAFGGSGSKAATGRWV
jgi:polyferredoxin